MLPINDKESSRPYISSKPSRRVHRSWGSSQKKIKSYEGELNYKIADLKKISVHVIKLYYWFLQTLLIRRRMYVFFKLNRAILCCMAYNLMERTCCIRWTFLLLCLLSMEPWAVTKKSFILVWRCFQLLFGFLANGHLPLVSRQSYLLRIRMKTDIKPGVVHRSPGIYFKTEDNPGKPQLGDRLIKGLCEQSSPQMGSLTSKWGR